MSKLPEKKIPTSEDSPNLGIGSDPENRGSTWIHFSALLERYGLDVLAILLFVVSILTLLGLSGLSLGIVILRWTQFIKTAFGWGSYLVILLLILIGLLSLQRHFSKPLRFRFRNILALEGWLFALVTLLAFLGRLDYNASKEGKFGGTIGWGLATLLNSFLPPIVSIIILSILNIAFILSGFMLSQWLINKIDTWLHISSTYDGTQHQNLSNDALTPSPTEEVVVRSPVRDQEADIGLFQRDERLPPLNLLINDHSSKPDEETVRATAKRIELTLEEFGVPARVIGYRIGPTVTQFAVEPGFLEKDGINGQGTPQKVRVAQISGLSKDLALALSAERLRIEAPVPGQSYVGIEVPNMYTTTVRLRPILESEAFQHLGSPLALALGRDVSGQPVVADLGRMPHMLIAGTTGSGKSVCIAAITTCLVMNNSPTELNLVMFDPKMVELVRFNGLPHLIGNVETDQTRIQAALAWTLAEMDNRYRILEEAKARDLESYNHTRQRHSQSTMPRIVVLIDELADLMMARPDQTEFSLVRLAQMARATGIHLIVATQRPSTEVVTGLIKANFPARISFNVASSTDSRVILDVNGAETLLGKGDMLFINPEVGTPQRSQGVIVTDHEIKKVVNFWQKMSPADNAKEIPWEATVLKESEEPTDDLIENAIDIVKQYGKASASLLQRRMRIGYPRAARLMDELEAMGVIGPSQTGGKDREVILRTFREEPTEDDPEQ